MTSDESTTAAYELACTVCAFEETVEGTFSEALDAADEHQEAHGSSPEHFVNVERTSPESETPRTS